MTLAVTELIAKKRDGGRLPPDEIRALVAAYTRGDVPDYQMSALLMAVMFRGLDDRETHALTDAMLHSGEVLDLSAIAGKKVDKHSTGGVGDKVSICLAPLVAAAGVRVPMVSGRGLGHTGGTLDKLESIPGFRTDLPTARFVEIVGEVGACLIGQTAQIAPADKKLYALRDVTATVESIPLIAASILSKKLAEGIDALVLDVKVGRGAFMKTAAQARALARAMIAIGRHAKKKVVAVLTAMDEPLGGAVGNALEVAEAIDVVEGRGPRDLVEVTLVLGAEMLVLGGVARSMAQARATLDRLRRDGSAARKLEEMIAAQGGDRRVVAEPRWLPRASIVEPIVAPRAGWVADIDALEVGLAAVALGAGRARVEDRVDPSVGFVLAKKRGDRVGRGETLFEVHANDRARAAAAAVRVRAAYRIAPTRPRPPRLVLGTVR